MLNRLDDWPRTSMRGLVFEAAETSLDAES